MPKKTIKDNRLAPTMTGGEGPPEMVAAVTMGAVRRALIYSFQKAVPPATPTVSMPGLPSGPVVTFFDDGSVAVGYGTGDAGVGPGVWLKLSAAALASFVESWFSQKVDSPVGFYARARYEPDHADPEDPSKGGFLLGPPEPRMKRRLTDEGAARLSALEGWVREHANVNSFTTKALVDLAGALGLDTSGSKRDLLQRIVAERIAEGGDR